MRMPMLLTIITINRNNAEGLARTMRSVLGQSDRTFEYVVVDGGSTDGSREVVEAHAEELTAWVSERDNGIFNAMNKGVSMAHGDYVLFVNSGDELYDKDVIAKVMPALAAGDADICSGALLRMERHPKVIPSPKRPTVLFLVRDSLPHPATFIRRERLLERPYDEDYRIVSDWAFNLRELLLYGAVYKRLDVTVSRFDLTGVSSLSAEARDDERRRYLLSIFPERLVDTLLETDIEDERELKRRRKIDMCLRQPTALGGSWKMWRNATKWLLGDLVGSLFCQGRKRR